ncbi:hypothetical protein ACJRO7_000203 [Eucalyptus globulus]|uniref:HotDog ACOT-type domain-containing protein n=1 Tax=Eucalyptus globulus TaxID=34317 RepID=A0ABD3LLV2_EUCGL
MASLHRTLSNRLLSKLPPFHPSWPRAARFSAAADGGAPAPPSSAAAPPPYESSPPIDAGSSIQKPISLWPGMYFSPVTNALWEARSKMFEEVGSAGANGKAVLPPPSELVPRSPARSRTSIFYKNPWNEIRMGKLVEDLDALAGTICYKPFSFGPAFLQVTASVDRMVLKRPIRIEMDLQIAGAVTWVGRSSMEIQLEVKNQDSSDSVALAANFTFVALTEREKLLWQEAENRIIMRKKKREERRVFCDMPALADRDSILIRDTSFENSLICQPQRRNIHGRIFRGFFMRKAFELAFSTSYAFAGVAPRFLEVDRVDFLRPDTIFGMLVDVGNFLRLKCSEPPIDVEVVARVMQPGLRSSEFTNLSSKTPLLPFFFFALVLLPSHSTPKRKKKL